MATATENWSVNNSISFGGFHNTARREWLVTGASDEREAIFASGVARWGQPHPRWTDLKVSNVSSTDKPGIDIHVVSATYDNLQRGASVKNEGELEAQPVIVQWLTAIYDRDLQVDAFGNPITSSSREPFPHAMTETIVNLRLSVKRWERDYDPGLAMTMMNGVNDKDFNVATGSRSRLVTAGQAKIMHIIPTQSYSENDDLVQVEYLFEFQESGWRQKRMDEGYYQSVVRNGTNAKELLSDSDYVEFDHPTRLDGKGQPIETELRDAGNLTGTGTPRGAKLHEDGDTVWLSYQTLPFVSFSKLGL